MPTVFETQLTQANAGEQQKALDQLMEKYFDDSLSDLFDSEGENQTPNIDEDNNVTSEEGMTTDDSSNQKDDPVGKEDPVERDNSENDTNESEEMSFAKEVVELTNDERTQRGLDPLEMDADLAKAAQNHSDAMASKDFFSHTGANGSSPFERIEDTGYDYSTAGENIAVGQQTPQMVVDSWMGSSGHRANILNPDFTEIGIGYEYLANDTGSVNYNHYWTQDFATPAWTKLDTTKFSMLHLYWRSHDPSRSGSRGLSFSVIAA